jgi:hypothetical protein
MHIVQDRGQRAWWQPLPDRGSDCESRAARLRRRAPPVIVRADRAEPHGIGIGVAIDKERDLVQTVWRRRWTRSASVRRAR